MGLCKVNNHIINFEFIIITLTENIYSNENKTHYSNPRSLFCLVSNFCLASKIILLLFLPRLYSKFGLCWLWPQTYIFVAKPNKTLFDCCKKSLKQLSNVPPIHPSTIPPDPDVLLLYVILILDPTLQSTYLSIHPYTHPPIQYHTFLYRQ